jgi:8-oxo-dGTP diphosphatase
MIGATLCHIIKDSKIQLLKKSAGRFGEGKWNAPGGKLEDEEDPEAGAIREVYEETGLAVMNLKLFGLLQFYFGQKQEVDWLVYVFSANDFLGKIIASDEGELRWFNLEKIPYTEMWEDDKHWLPLLLNSKQFEGTFFFDSEGKSLLDFKIES